MTIVTTVMAIVSLLGVLTGAVGPALWAVVIEALLATGFAHYYAKAA